MRSSGFMRHSDPHLVTWQPGPAVPACDMGMDTSVATKERITCLCGLCGQKEATSGETCAGADFQQAAYEVMSECVRSVRKSLEHAQQKTRNVQQQPRLNVESMRFGMVGQIPLEIIAWLRHAFGLTQQVLTSALTCNCLFPVAPTVLGTSWGDSPVSKHWKVTVDDFCAGQTGQVAQWSHRCLLVLNEPRDGALSRLWEKINATARLRQVVVVIRKDLETNACHGNTTGVTQQMMSRVQNWLFSLQALSLLATLLGGITMLMGMGQVTTHLERPLDIATHGEKCLLITESPKTPHHYRYLIMVGPRLHPLDGIEWCSVLRLLLFLCILRFRIFKVRVLNAME